MNPATFLSVFRQTFPVFKIVGEEKYVDEDRYYVWQSPQENEHLCTTVKIDFYNE